MSPWRAETMAWIVRVIAGLAVLPLASGPAFAAEPDAADRAWIETCIADREGERLDPESLRKYCACMQEIVEDNRPFGVRELERSYPPAHEMCHATSGLK